MYLYGGSGPNTLSDTPAPSLWTLDLKTYKWEIVVPKGAVQPPIRDDHTAVICGHNSMVVFGGFVDGERTNDILRYHFKENRWEVVEIRGGVAPKPRAGHSAVIY